MSPSKKKSRRPARISQPRRSPVLPVVLGVVVLLGVVALILSLGGDDDGVASGVEQFRSVQVVGTPLAPLAETVDAAVGSAAPELEGASFDGTPVTITNDGRPKVVVFLAHWCPHCQREVPEIARWLAEQGRPADVDLYAVATNTNRSRPNFPPSTWLDREGFGITTLADDRNSRAGQAFGLSGFPFFAAIDREGRIVTRGAGAIGVEGLERLIDLARTA